MDIKKYIYLSFFLLSTTGILNAQEVNIQEAQLKFPSPAIPFYHFKVELETSNSAITNVQAVVNNDTLRSLKIYGNKEFERLEMDKPAVTHRPPSAYALSEDTTKYKNPYLIGWVRWKPDNNYKINITGKLNNKATGNKERFSVTKTVTAPCNAPVFDSAWKNYKALVVSETAGIDRTREPVEVLLPFYPDQAKNIKKSIRVVAIDPETHKLSVVPSQLYDIKKFLKEDNMKPLKKGKAEREVPLWYPTITARVTFLASVPANSSRVYLIYYNNTNAKAKSYQTNLQVQGNISSGMKVRNNKLTAKLKPKSGILNRIKLNSKPNAPLFHAVETNGAIQWNPGVYSPPRPWAHVSDWKSPHTKSIVGPVVVMTRAWDNLHGIPEVDASVMNKFYPGKPYFISSTSMRINKTIHTLALRNGEMVFKRDLMTHAAWYSVVRDSNMVYKLKDLATLEELKMEADVPWITFYNENTGIGFAGIQLDYANTGIESRPRLLNPYFYITVGPWVYWARALSVSYVSSNHQQMIPAMKGNTFSEKWAYLIYEINKNGKPYAPVLKWKKKLTNPLRIQLVEKVDERVSKSITEIVSGGKSPWEKSEK